MTGRDQGTRRMRRGRRAVAIGATMAAVAAMAAAMSGPVSGALASPTAAGISRAGQAAGSLTDVSGTPAGWSPVPYESAQLSVPGSWLVESPQQLWCGPTPGVGMIFAGITPGFPKGLGCALTASLAWILPAGKLPKGISH